MSISDDLIVYFKETHSVDVTESTPLIGDGIIDSMGVVDLLTHVSEQYQVEFGGEDMTEENLGTVSSIAKLIKKMVD